MARQKLTYPNFNLSVRKDGYWQIRYREGNTTRTVAAGTKDRKEAERFRTGFVKRYDKSQMEDIVLWRWELKESQKHPEKIKKVRRRRGFDSDLTICDVIDIYLEYHAPLVASFHTLEHTFEAPVRILGRIKADDFRQSDVEMYIKRRVKDKPQGRFAKTQSRVSDATINKELRMVRAALNWAYADKMIKSPPTFRIALTRGIVRDRWITKDDAMTLLREASPHIALFILIALSTARRSGAILDLTWDKVDLSRRGHEIIDFGADVGLKKRGQSPIAGNMRLITALKEAQEEAVKKYATADKRHVIEWRGKRMHSVKTGLYAASKRAGIERLGAHVLKHTAITWMVQAGLTYEVISRYTNTSKEMVERTYGHHSPGFVAGAAAAVAL